MNPGKRLELIAELLVVTNQEQHDISYEEPILAEILTRAQAVQRKLQHNIITAADKTDWQKLERRAEKRPIKPRIKELLVEIAQSI